MSVITNLDIQPINGLVGAEIRGVDLARTLDTDVVAAIKAALHRYDVIFFPDQSLDVAAHLALGNRFGEVVLANPVYPGGLRGEPFVRQITHNGVQHSDYNETVPPGPYAGWHSDQTFVERPPSVGILHAVQMPEAGGDTLFASTKAAYERLSEPFRTLVDPLVAVHGLAFDKLNLLLQSDGPKDWEGQQVSSVEPIEHPVVRIHPETGGRSLYVNPNRTSYIKGLSTRESDALLNLLYAHITSHEHVIRYKWRAGAVAFWDNRTVLHNGPVRDFGDGVRVIQRVQLRGERPYGLSFGAS
jgi:alpha-ketoglutarate-dependent taurine dioxygenase